MVRGTGSGDRAMREAENLLARKLRHDGVARSPLPDTDFVGETFARQAERALRALVKTGVSAIVLECKVVKVAEAVRDITVPTMLGLIEIENGKVQGLLNLDTDFAYHLIDLMLGGGRLRRPGSDHAHLHRSRHGALPASP